MSKSDFGRVDIEPLDGGDMWLVWNSHYGRHADSGDMGYVQKIGERYVAYCRNDAPTVIGEKGTLDAAVEVLRAAY